MARVRVTYWRDIPVLVTGRDAAAEVNVPLSPRFQELVDAVAMRSGLAEPDAYLAEWRAGPEEERPGSAREVADQVAGELEQGFADARARHAEADGESGQ